MQCLRSMHSPAPGPVAPWLPVCWHLGHVSASLPTPVMSLRPSCSERTNRLAGEVSAGSRAPPGCLSAGAACLAPAALKLCKLR